jgi:hypothetical protein
VASGAGCCLPLAWTTQEYNACRWCFVLSLESKRDFAMKVPYHLGLRDSSSSYLSCWLEGMPRALHVAAAGRPRLLPLMPSRPRVLLPAAPAVLLGFLQCDLTQEMAHELTPQLDYVIVKPDPGTASCLKLYAISEVSKQMFYCMRLDLRGGRLLQASPAHDAGMAAQQRMPPSPPAHRSPLPGPAHPAQRPAVPAVCIPPVHSLAVVKTYTSCHQRI